jgi:hypothetical protein
VIKRLDGRRHASRQVPVGFTRIRLTDHNYSSAVHLQRARLRRERPDRSAAENDDAIFSAILDLVVDPAWEGVQ